MPIGLITRFPEGMGAEQYDPVNAKIDMESAAPEGLLMHCCGELDGRFQVFDLWETRDHHDRFRDGRLKDAMVEVMGADVYAELPDAERVETQIHNHFIP